MCDAAKPCGRAPDDTAASAAVFFCGVLPPAAPLPRPRHRVRGLALALTAVTAVLGVCADSGATAPKARSSAAGHVAADTAALAALLPASLDTVDASVAELARERHERVMDLAREATAGDTAQALADLAMVFEANDLWAPATNAWEAAIDHAGGVRAPPAWHFHHAIVLREIGELEHAATVLEALADREPALPWVQERLGEALLEQGRLAAARVAYERVIALAPDAPFGYTGVGDVLLREQRYAGAAEVLERAVSIAPGYRQARYMLGIAYRGVGRLEQAALELRRGVDARRDYLDDPLAADLRKVTVNAPALRNAASGLLAGGQPQEAAQIYEALLRRGAADIDDINNLAVAYMQLGRFDQAHAFLEQSATLRPDRFGTQLNLASLALRQRDAAAAREHANRAVALAPDIARTHVMLARVEAASGAWGAAEASLARAGRLDTRDPQLPAMHGDVLLRLGRPADAEARFAQALVLWPDYLPAQLSLARLRLARGEIGGARDLLERARALAPSHPGVRALAEQLDRADGDAPASDAPASDGPASDGPASDTPAGDRPQEGNDDAASTAPGGAT